MTEPQYVQGTASGNVAEMKIVQDTVLPRGAWRGQGSVIHSCFYRKSVPVTWPVWEGLRGGVRPCPASRLCCHVSAVPVVLKRERASVGKPSASPSPEPSSPTLHGGVQRASLSTQGTQSGGWRPRRPWVAFSCAQESNQAPGSSPGVHPAFNEYE